MLEAFVHDPLINWRLLNATEAATEAALARDTDAAGDGAGAAPSVPPAAAAAAAAAAVGLPAAPALGAPAAAAAAAAGPPAPVVPTGAAGIMAAAQGDMPSPPQRGARERELREARDQLRDQHGASRGQRQHRLLCAVRRHRRPHPASNAHRPCHTHARSTHTTHAPALPGNTHTHARTHAAGDASEVLNERAMAVMKRMTDKLMGRDHMVDGSGGGGGGSGGAAAGGPAGAAGVGGAAAAAAAEQPCDSVPAQVQRLIAQAMSHENLCQSYIGWCPFW
jgi:hypothetical protein